MPRRPTARSRARSKSNASPAQAGATPRAEPARKRKRKPIRLWAIGGAAAVAVALVSTLIWVLVVNSPARLRVQAESAARAGDWETALQAWRSVNATKSATNESHLGEATACRALNRASQAERSLRRAIAADPTNLEPWKLLLEILQVEDRPLEAQRLGWEAYDRLPPEARRDLLQELTQGLLVELPDERVRTALGRWIDADGDDIDAQVALLQRIAAQPRASDPDRSSLLAIMETLLAGHPDHIGAREALVAALADAGEPERGRALLDNWPEKARDARYWRLRGRWELEYDHRPEQAAAAFQTAVAELPQDWRSWYRLARALRILGRDREGHQAAETVSRIREALDPLTLGPQLVAAFDHLDDPAALRNLALLCDRAGLNRLADAWRTEARVPIPTPGSVAP
jgi:thioredoxin-like negative regulator of GroEL